MPNSEQPKRLPWGPHEKYIGPTMRNVRVGDQLGVLYEAPRKPSHIAIPPSHYQPPLDTLRFLPEYFINRLGVPHKKPARRIGK